MHVLEMVPRIRPDQIRTSPHISFGGAYFGHVARNMPPGTSLPTPSLSSVLLIPYALATEILLCWVFPVSDCALLRNIAQMLLPFHWNQ